MQQKYYCQAASSPTIRQAICSIILAEQCVISGPISFRLSETLVQRSHPACGIECAHWRAKTGLGLVAQRNPNTDIHIIRCAIIFVVRSDLLQRIVADQIHLVIQTICNFDIQRNITTQLPLPQSSKQSGDLAYSKDKSRPIPFPNSVMMPNLAAGPMNSLSPGSPMATA